MRRGCIHGLLARIDRQTGYFQIRQSVDAVSLATGWNLPPAQTLCWSRLKRSLKLWLLLRDAFSLSPADVSLRATAN